MNKKLIDIIPPGEASRSSEVLKPEREGKEEVVAEEEPIIEAEKQQPEESRRVSKKSFKKRGLTFSFLVLILVAVYCYFSLAEAKIEIWPKEELLTFSTEVTASEKAGEVSLSDSLIPGEIIEVEKTVSDEFSATGNAAKENKATGIIRVYNDYNVSQTLIAGTRLQAPAEKFQPSLEGEEKPWFKTKARIVIAPKSYTDVQVEAYNSGSKYNIEPSVFSIPGLAGTSQYTFVYGKSSEKFSGGSKEATSVVTKKDLDDAKEKMEEKSLEESQNTLKSKIASGSFALEGTLKSEVIETFTTTIPNTEAQTFTYRAKAKAEAFVIKKKDLEDFVKSFITSKITEDKRINEQGLKIKYSARSLNLNSGKVVLSLSMEAKIYFAIDENYLKTALKEKSFSEAKTLLESQPQIAKSQLNLWPFWVGSVPGDPSKVEIALKLD